MVGLQWVGGSEGTTPPPSPDLEGVSRGKEAGGGVSSSSPAQEGAERHPPDTAP